MNNDEIKHLQELIQIHRNRLMVLEKQAAKYGISCPAEIQVEIEEIVERIDQIDRQIRNGSIYSFFDGRKTINQFGYDIKNVEHKLEQVTVREEKVYRFLGIPVWIVTISRTIILALLTIFMVGVLGVLTGAIEIPSIFIQIPPTISPMPTEKGTPQITPLPTESLIERPTIELTPLIAVLTTAPPTVTFTPVVEPVIEPTMTPNIKATTQARSRATATARAVQATAQAIATVEALQSSVTISNFRVTEETDSTATFLVDYSYDGAYGNRIYLSPECRSNGRSMSLGSDSIFDSLSTGSGTLTFRLSCQPYPDDPSQTTDHLGISVSIWIQCEDDPSARCSRLPVFSRMFEHVKTWPLYRDTP